MKLIVTVIMLGMFLNVAASLEVRAGWLDDAVRDAVENMGRRAVDEAADSMYEGTKESAKRAGESITNPDGQDDEKRGEDRKTTTEEE